MKRGLTNVLSSGLLAFSISTTSYAGGFSITSSTPRRTTEGEYASGKKYLTPEQERRVGKWAEDKALGYVPGVGWLFEKMIGTAEWKRSRPGNCGGAIDSCITRDYKNR